MIARSPGNAARSPGNAARTGAAIVTASLGVGLLAVASAPAASAKSPRVIETAQCGPVFTKLKVSPEDGGMEVEYELDQNRTGKRWSLRMSLDGQQVASGSRVTAGRSGSFEWRVVTADPAGTNTWTVTARRGSTTCTLSASM